MKKLTPIVWLAIALPALYQLYLLGTAIAGRVGYPYDLEWMEGGMLHHAMRIQNGQGIYVPPSIDFIPYLYTPLYPGLLALFGGLTGLSYPLGRAFSILSLVGMAAIAYLSIAGKRHRHVEVSPALCGATLAIGLFAATYPYVEGWFDLVRADTMFLAIATAGIAAIARWSAIGEGREGHARVGAGAVILVLAFFTKQTGFFYVAFGGAIVLAHSWRRAITYTVVAGALGLGMTALLNYITDRWFWIYVSEIHRAHDFNWDRFVASFGKILWHFPAMTLVIVAGLGVTAAAWIKGRRFPPQAQPLMLWSAAYAVSTVVGAIGWGTEFAHFNAYMPAFLHGALAAGAALPAMAASMRVLVEKPREGELSAFVLPVVAGIALAATLATSTWDPAKFIPTDRDRAAGDKLIADIASIPGDVWVPSHPWYAYLAGKTPHVHRMGVKDVTAREPRPVRGLEDTLDQHMFSAIVFDQVDLDTEWQPELVALKNRIAADYRIAKKLGPDEQPRVYTGAQVKPESIWVPAVPARPPSNARVLFDFEAGSWDGWAKTGGAWGHGPEVTYGTAPVAGATGHRLAVSSDSAIGKVTSPPFTIDGTKISMRLGGSPDHKVARVELWVDEQPVRTAYVPEPGGATLRDQVMEVADWKGKTAKLVLVDEGTAKGGVLLVDDVWMWTDPPAGPAR